MRVSYSRHEGTQGWRPPVGSGGLPEPVLQHLIGVRHCGRIGIYART
jgi:hypothetical protein